MSNERKKAMDMIQTLPEDKVIFVLAYMQGLEDGADDIPNDETIAAIKENEEARKSGSVTTWKGSTAELFKQILSED